MKTVKFDEKLWQIVPRDPDTAMIQRMAEGGISPVAALYHWRSITSVAPQPPETQIGQSLLRAPNELPIGCHCQMGKCSAPHPSWCRDAVKRDTIPATETK
jgi:hypothetical protein